MTRGHVDEVLKGREKKSIQQILESDKKIILIEGTPGVGKSTLSWELCRKWEETEKYDLVIHFNLREDCVQKMQKMSDLFSTCEDEGDRAYIIKRVKECKGRGVLFILDGYDELPKLSEHTNKEHANFQEEGLFRDLINRKYELKLQESTVIITSRHSARKQFEICDDQEIVKYVILGFNKENIKKYAKEVFKDESEQFVDFIYRNPTIENAVYVPINLVIITEIYKDNPAESKDYTSTELYRLFCQLFFQKSIKKFQWEELVRDKTFIQLRKLAFSGMKCNKLTFHDIDLRDCNEEVRKILDKRPSLGDASYSFPHLTFQEFLAACYISHIYGEDKVKLFSEFKEDRWNVVWNFVAGLTKFTFIDSNNFKRFTYDESDTNSDSDIRPFFFQNLFESQQESFDYCACGIEDMICEVISSWTPLDAYAAGYCIAKYTKPNNSLWKVAIGCYKNELGAVSFMQGLCCHASNPTGSNIGSFHVSGSETMSSDNEIVFLELLNKTIEQFKKVSNFSIDKFFLPMSILSTIISKMSNLVKLDISYSDVEGDGNKFLHHLSNTKIKELNVQYTGIECFLDYTKGASPYGDLQTLSIGTHNCDTDPCGKNLVHLASSYSSLRHLTIIGFPISSFNTSKFLTELVLVDNFENDESIFTAEDLVRILKEIQTLKILNLNGLLIAIPKSTDGLIMIFGALKYCRSLETIKFVSDCGFGVPLAPNMGPDKTVNDDVSDSIVPSIKLYPNDEVIKALKDMTKEISIENRTRVQLELNMRHKDLPEFTKYQPGIFKPEEIPQTVEMTIVIVDYLRKSLILK